MSQEVDTPQRKGCLLIIDMINEFTFDGSEHVLPLVGDIARNIARLKGRMKKAKMPVVYVNDNFGKWNSDFRKLVSRCMESHCKGKGVIELLLPEEDDYFVLKPKHSGFYGTPLDLLLQYLDVQRLILTGLLGNNCVLYTAADAYMRDFDVAVPSDCVVSFSPEANANALKQMQETLNATIMASDKIFDELIAHHI